MRATLLRAGCLIRLTCLNQGRFPACEHAPAEV
jgi:hypothetical protein